MAWTETPDHHGSHRRLIWSADGSPTPQAKVDAIIVPTARPVAYLNEAARVAVRLDCPLVTLHSKKWTSAEAAAGHLAESVDLIAIDMPEPAQLRLPELETSRLLERTIFRRRIDLSAKRNLALMLSHMLGWERVVFLDDDIQVPEPSDVSRAVGLLDIHTAVGLGIDGFPDNSVVCHAFRHVGGKQETFIGGGALAVEAKRNRSFFPEIYNDDWFYVLDAGKRLQSVATIGQVMQNPYDPYRRPERARNEEFGDVLAEGTFWLLDQGKTASDGDLPHWQEFLERRRRFIEDVLDKVKQKPDIEAAQRGRMIEALKASLGRRALIKPELCVDYLRAWVSDQERWQRHIQGVRQQPSLGREWALRSLGRKGRTPLTWYTRQSSSAPEPSAVRYAPPAGRAGPPGVRGGSARRGRPAARRGEVPAVSGGRPVETPSTGWRQPRPGELEREFPPSDLSVPVGLQAVPGRVPAVPAGVPAADGAEKQLC